MDYILYMKKRRNLNAEISPRIFGNAAQPVDGISETNLHTAVAVPKTCLPSLLKRERQYQCPPNHLGVNAQKKVKFSKKLRNIPTIKMPTIKIFGHNSFLEILTIKFKNNADFKFITFLMKFPAYQITKLKIEKFLNE